MTGTQTSDKSTKSSNTGLLIGLVVVGIIAIVALILSIIPLFQGDDNKDDSNGNPECPKSGCDIDAKSIKATTITAGDITATGTIEYESLEATASTILNLTSTNINSINISNTSGVFTDTLRSRRIDNTSLISSTFINATELTLFSILSQPGVRVDNSGSVSPKNITLDVKNYFYSVQLFATSTNNIQLNLSLSALRNGQSMFINCWAAGVSTVNGNTDVNLVINRPSGSTLNVVNTTTAASAFLDTSTTTASIKIFTRGSNFTNPSFINYLAYFTDSTLYIILISKS